jgi:adenine/guanine/hypoxanthine permease
VATGVSARRRGWESYFKIRERDTTVRTELIAGLTTFMTMAYILFVNPNILTALPDSTGTQLDRAAVLTVTALAAGLACLAMGLFANYPFAIAAGLGLNAVVAFELVGIRGLSWEEAMGVVVVEGIVILILVLTKFRQAVMEAVPLPLKHAIAVGIGLFIAIIGFVDGGFVTSPDTAPPRGAGPALQLGTNAKLQGWPVAIFIIGLLLIIFLYTRRVRGALLIGILATTVLAVVINEAFLDGQGFGEQAQYGGIAEIPGGDNFELIGNFSFGFFAALGWITAILVVFSIMLSDFFDTMGTAVGLAGEANLLTPEGKIPDVDRVLMVDSGAAAVGGAFSASSNTTYIESASGIAEGGRTGLTAVIVGVLFLLSVFFAPLAEIIPLQATAPALVVVGFLMMTQVRRVPWDDFELSIPAFLTMVVMPYTYSITNGIGAGFISYVFIKLVRGKAGQVHPMMYIAAAAFLIYFGIIYVEDWLT